MRSAHDNPQVGPEAAARRRLRARIALACKSLGIGDEAYRAILAERYGADSSTALAPRQLTDLALHLEGYATGNFGRPRPRPAIEGYMRKVAGLLQELGELGPPGPTRFAYAEAAAHNMFYRGSRVTVVLELLGIDQLRKVIAALEAAARRRRATAPGGGA